MKPGEGSLSPECTLVFDGHDQGAIACRIRFVGHILLDFDEHTSLHRDLVTHTNATEDSDFKLICEEQVFPCHKLFLKARSSVFRDAFASSLNSNEFRIESFKPDSVKKMLKFIYSNSIEDNVDADLLKLADFFNIQALTKLCEQRLSEIISKDNIFDLLTLAESVSQAEILKVNVMDFIVKNYNELKEKSKWNTLDKRLLNEILDKALA
jgi:hypothetical protein